MKIKLTRSNTALAFRAANAEGQTIDIDANPSVGGQGLGMRPMEILASSLASCASIDVLLILQKKRINLNFYEVEVEAVRKSTVPAAFESIHLTFKIAQNDPQETVEKAVALSINKYCSVAAMLHPNCKITYQTIQVPSARSVTYLG